MKRNVTFMFQNLPEMPDFIASQVFLSSRYANSIDLVKICLHSFFLRISYIFVTFEIMRVLYVLFRVGYNISAAEKAEQKSSRCIFNGIR